MNLQHTPLADASMNKLSYLTYWDVVIASAWNLYGTLAGRHTNDHSDIWHHESSDRSIRVCTRYAGDAERADCTESAEYADIFRSQYVCKHPFFL